MDIARGQRTYHPGNSVMDSVNGSGAAATHGRHGASEPRCIFSTVPVRLSVSLTPPASRQVTVDVLGFAGYKSLRRLAHRELNPAVSEPHGPSLTGTNKITWIRHPTRGSDHHDDPRGLCGLPGGLPAPTALAAPRRLPAAPAPVLPVALPSRAIPASLSTLRVGCVAWAPRSVKL